ncbi:MAG: DNA repair protein RecN [Fimbriiglobus sp.]
MLRELAVQNLALIEDVRVELAAGFCAWTGETGAGKSLLLGAIGLLLGERGSVEIIRAGQDELRITGRFEFTRAEQREAAREMLQTEFAEDELILTRRLSRTGRSSALANEQPISVSTLRKLGEMLVDIHGQRESYSLLQPAYQLELLDAFGRLTDLRQTYIDQADKVRELRRQRVELSNARATRQRELALLRFEREELDTIALKPGELETMLKDREKLIHAQSLASFTGSVASRLYDNEDSVAVVLGRLVKEAGKWVHLDKKLADVAKRLETLRPEVEDLAETCRDLAEAFEADPETLDAIEHRLQTFKKLESKYGKSIPELIAYRATLDAQERKLQQQEDDLAGIDQRLAAAFAELKSVAVELSKGRAKVAKKLASEAQKQLTELQMPKAKLEAQLEVTPLSDDPNSEVPAFGIDHLELMLTANPGEPARPLRKVASGGEMSRTMLALKTVLAAHDPVRTLVVFDEIDANVGGRIGDVLGQKLAILGASHQVLCVTHLPQVACFAHHHWTIRKATTGKRTATTITHLQNRDDRIEELAIMLRGETRSETTRQEAKEMLTSAGR